MTPSQRLASYEVSVHIVSVADARRWSAPARSLTALVKEVVGDRRAALPQRPVSLLGFDGGRWRDNPSREIDGVQEPVQLRILSWNIAVPSSGAVPQLRTWIRREMFIRQRDIILLQQVSKAMAIGELMSNETVRRDWLMTEWDEIAYQPGADLKRAIRTNVIMVRRSLPFSAAVTLSQFRRQRVPGEQRNLLVLTLSHEGREIARIGNAELDDGFDAIRGLQLMDCVDTLGRGSSSTGPIFVCGISHDSKYELPTPLLPGKVVMESILFHNKPTNNVFQPTEDGPLRSDHLFVSTGVPRSMGSRVWFKSAQWVGQQPVDGAVRRSIVKEPGTRQRRIYATRRPGLSIDVELPPLSSITPPSDFDSRLL